jgi:hypothetical protein
MQWANAATTISPASSNTSELLQYLHACCFSPSQTTWIQTIRNGHFTTWLCIPISNITKLLPNSITTALGHLDQKNKNYRSTQESTTTNDTKSFEPSPLQDGKQTHSMYATIQEIHGTTGTIASNQTGRFPVTSAQGMKCLIVLYDYDSNVILA